MMGKAVSSKLRWQYKKWLRYYLDFCNKYKHPSLQNKSMPLFIEKLKEKKQTVPQREQAASAIRLYLEMETASNKQVLLEKPIAPASAASGNQHRRTRNSALTAVSPPRTEAAPCIREPGISETKAEPEKHPGKPPAAIAQASDKKLRGASWVAEYAKLSNEIKVRHYSPKTLQTYTGWVRKFQTFTASKDPGLLSTEDVKGFLTSLAVKHNMAASSQNQAYNALLFFFRHVLNKEFGRVDGVVRAKRKPYIPTVLSRHEIDAILAHLSPPYDLVVKLLYGCGLRLMECMRLRINCFNFDAGMLTVHDGKGKKDRSVPLPEIIIPELSAHLDSLKTLYRRDMDRKFAGVFLMNRLGKKNKNAAKEFAWQWVFPARQLTFVEKERAYRRHHLHETHVQKAIKAAVKDAAICKRASANTLRHSFASHLLQANYDIRTIQELLGHSHVRTTMIYTRTIKSQTLKTAKSPLDF
jgi:integron integrase